MGEMARQRRPESRLDRAENPGTGLAGPRHDRLLQMAAGLNARAANKTGLPDRLKAGVEALSGLSMDAVRVHYNSSQPARLNAAAYARGADIHVAPGQERHLPHEAWHVVQQAQGRVEPTRQLKGAAPVNDDAGLEREADVMGARALAAAPGEAGPADMHPPGVADPTDGRRGVIQRKLGFEYELGNVTTYTKGPAVGGGQPPKVRLARQHVLAQHPGGFDVTADDPPTGAPAGALSDLELIIQPPLDDNVPENRAVLKDMLATMVAYVQSLKTATTNPEHETEVAANTFIGAASANLLDDGMLQATAGLSPGGLANLASGRTEDSAEASRGALQTERDTLSNTWFVLNKTEKLGALDAKVHNAALQTLMAMGAANRQVYGLCHGALGNIADPTDRDLVAAVLSRIATIPITARTRTLPYAKSAAGGLMARSDFATILGMLPPTAMAAFPTGADFDNRLLAAIRLGAADPGIALTDRVFPNPIVGAPALTITLGEWFAGLYPAVGRADRLTTANYPHANPAEAAAMESLGSYGNRTDPPTAGATQRSIHEFRNLGSIPLGALVETGLAVWDLVQRANHGTEA